jgi:carbon-monoxide dehydrogenase small subunit
MKKVDIKINVNGDWYELAVNPGDRLVDVLRDRLDLTGTKEGCSEGECGACTVNLDGQAILSCLMLAVQADGCNILTIEGLQSGAKLHPLQKAFVSESAIQCGFCTPGMVMTAKALLDKNPDPDRSEIAAALKRNLCRCTGYVKIIDAVRLAAERLRVVGS